MQKLSTEFPHNFPSETFSISTSPFDGFASLLFPTFFPISHSTLIRKSHIEFGGRKHIRHNPPAALLGVRGVDRKGSGREVWWTECFHFPALFSGSFYWQTREKFFSFDFSSPSASCVEIFRLRLCRLWKFIYSNRPVTDAPQNITKVRWPFSDTHFHRPMTLISKIWREKKTSPTVMGGSVECGRVMLRGEVFCWMSASGGRSGGPNTQVWGQICVAISSFAE